MVDGRSHGPRSVSTSGIDDPIPGTPPATVLRMADEHSETEDSAIAESVVAALGFEPTTGDEDTSNVDAIVDDLLGDDPGTVEDDPVAEVVDDDDPVSAEISADVDAELVDESLDAAEAAEETESVDEVEAAEPDADADVDVFAYDSGPAESESVETADVVDVADEVEATDDVLDALEVEAAASEDDDEPDTLIDASGDDVADDDAPASVDAEATDEADPSNDPVAEDPVADDTVADDEVAEDTAPERAAPEDAASDDDEPIELAVDLDGDADEAAEDATLDAEVDDDAAAETAGSVFDAPDVVTDVDELDADALEADLPLDEVPDPEVSVGTDDLFPDLPGPIEAEPEPALAAATVDLDAPVAEPVSATAPAAATAAAAAAAADEPRRFARRRRLRARKVRRVVRHIDPWSVLTFSVLFHLALFTALLLAGVLLWNAAVNAGTVESVESFIEEIGDYEAFEIDSAQIFRSAVIIAGTLTLASSVLLVLLTVVFNLISDLIGGIRVTVIEEETVQLRPKKRRKDRSRS